MDETRKKTIVIEVSQTQKDKYGMQSLIWTLTVKSMITKLQSIEPQKVGVE